MENFCIVVNKNRDEKMVLTERVKEILSELGKKTAICVESANQRSKEEEIPEETEAVIVLGGDGTMIRAARRLCGRNTPMLGINTGTLGYLTAVEVRETERALRCLVRGEFHVENRMMLDIFYDGDYSDTVLNEVAITRSGVSRLIQVAVSVNGVLLDVVAGDGILVSTPTGSTGYNLSAGGPIVKPEAELIMITPLCPHSLSSRPVIVAGEDEITLEVMQDKKAKDVEVMATYDGREAMCLKAGEKIVIRKSKYQTKLIKLDERSFFEVLRSKLGTVER